MSVAKAILIVGGIGVGAYVLLQVARPAVSTTPASSASSSPSNTTAIFTGLLNFGAALVNQLGTNGSNTNGSTTSNYNAGTAYAPGSTSPGPWAPKTTTESYNPNTANATVYV